MSALLMSHIVHTALMLSIAAAAQQTGAAQEPQPTPAGQVRTQRPAPEVIRVLPIKYGNAMELMNVGNSTGLNGRLTADSRSNSLVFAGSNEELSRVEQLIAQLDRPMEKEAPSGISSRLVALQFRSSDELAKAAQMALELSDRSLRILADSARNNIIITGRESSMALADDLIRHLDTPTPTAQLEFALFHADLTRPVGAGSLPEDLANVGKELAKLGEYKLLGRLSTVALEREPFEVEGSIGRELSVEISGMLVHAAADGVRLRLNARMWLIRADAGVSGQSPPRTSSQPTGARGGDSPIGEFRVQSTLIARIGDTVIVGAAPAGWKPGESAVLVVRVRQ